METKNLEPPDYNFLKNLLEELLKKPPVPVEEQNFKLAELTRQLRN